MMNARSWLVSLILFLCCGCSEVICGAGLDLCSFSTQENVRKEFGRPLEYGTYSGDVKDGKTFDEYVTHRKIAHNQGMYGMAVAMTCGLCELFAFPWQTLVAGQNILFGRRIRYIYDQDGKIVRVLEEGEWYHGPFRLHSSNE